MFKVVRRESILWPITIRLPKGDGTKRIDEFKIKVRYKLLKRSQLNEIVASANSENSDDDSQDFDIVNYILDWQDVLDEHGEPLPYSQDMAEELLEDPHIAKAFTIGFWEAQNGASAKN